MTKMPQTDIDNANLMSTFIRTNLSSIMASNVKYIANSKWFDCLSIRIRHIPSFGFLQMHYDFNEIKDKLTFNHRLVISQISIDNKDNTIGDKLCDFKMTFEKEFKINKIYLLGRKLSNQDENAHDFRIINTVHYLADSQELLVAADWSTSRIIITTDKEEIKNFKNYYLTTNNNHLQFELLEIDTEKNSR